MSYYLNRAIELKKEFGIKTSFLYFIYLFELFLSKLGVGKRKNCAGCGTKRSVFLPMFVPPNHIRSYFSCPQCGISARHLYYAQLSRKYIFPKLDSAKEYVVYHFIPENALITIWKEKLPKSNYTLTCYPEKMDGYELLDLKKLAIADASIDIILINHVLSCTDDISNVFKELYRVLKIGGLVIAGEAVFDQKTTKELTQFNAYGTRYRSFGVLDLADVVEPFTQFEIVKDLSVMESFSSEFLPEESLMVLRK